MELSVFDEEVMVEDRGEAAESAVQYVFIKIVRSTASARQSVAKRPPASRRAARADANTLLLRPNAGASNHSRTPVSLLEQAGSRARSAMRAFGA